MNARGRASGGMGAVVLRHEGFVFQYMGSRRLHYGRGRARREGETRGRDARDDEGRER